MLYSRSGYNVKNRGLENQVSLKANEERISATTYLRCKDAAIEALEKQIPKKIVVREDSNNLLKMFCPNCDSCFGIYGDIFIPTTSKYCYLCGQKLDWSNSNDNKKT